MAPELVYIPIIAYIIWPVCHVHHTFAGKVIAAKELLTQNVFAREKDLQHRKLSINILRNCKITHARAPILLRSKSLGSENHSSVKSNSSPGCFFYIFETKTQLSKKYFSTLSLLFTNTYGSNKKQRRF